jgi:hypothetical protein
MNRGLFEKYVNKKRDCDARLLDDAVQKGIRRAQDDKLDPRKLINLAAVFAITLAAIFSIAETPIQAEASNYFVNRNHPMRDNAHALDASARQFVNTLLEFLGDD